MYQEIEFSEVKWQSQDHTENKNVNQNSDPGTS